MRPQSIVAFERLFLTAQAISVASFLFHYRILVEQLGREAILVQLGIGAGVVIGVATVIYATYLLLWFLIARRRSNVAKWVLIALVALSLVSVLGAIGGAWHTAKVASLVVTALEVAAVFHLFRPDAAAWLKNKGPSEQVSFE